MSSHARWGASALLAAALAALAPASARAYDWAGRLGLSYDRIETWNGPEYSLVPKLRLDGILAARGSFVDRGVIDWWGNVRYEDYSATYGPANEDSNTLGYALNVGILQTPAARASLSGSVSRSRSDYSMDAEAARTTGTSTTNDWSVRGYAGPRGLPGLVAAYSNRDIVNSGLGREETSETWKTLDLSTQVGQSNLNSNIAYQSQWVTGSLPALNFQSQTVNLQTSMSPADGVGSGLNVLYFLRDPTALAATNPRLETTMVTANLGWGHRLAEADGAVQYLYNHSSATDPSLVVRDVMSNTAILQYGRRITPEWRWIGALTGAYQQRRIGETVESSNANQTVGLTFDYARTAGGGATGASIGGRIGANEPDHGSTELAYGVNGSFRRNWQGASHLYAFNYSVSYDQNLAATGGWTTMQSLFAELRSATGGWFRYSARLQAGGARGGGGTFGDNANRSITAYGSVAYRRVVLDLEVGAIDAVTGALQNPISDSLFVPAGYNTRSRYAATTFSWPLAERLGARFLAKYTILSGPSTPDQREGLLNPSLWYSFGLWTFSLEDRYTVGGTSSFDHRVNELFVRASRSFGGR